MRKIKNKILSILLIIIMTVVVGGCLFGDDSSYGQGDTLINIAELPTEFMDNYFQTYSDVSSASESAKENMLIVTSPEQINDSYGATSVIAAPNNQYILQYDSPEVKDAALAHLRNDNSLAAVEENQLISFENYNSWGIEAMGLSGANHVAATKDLPEVRVAILDTGCDTELINKYYPDKIAETYNVLKEATNNVHDVNDTFGHGTHIAGIIAEGTPSNVKIVPVKIANTSEQWVSDAIAGINYITYYQKADVINMSFGAYIKGTALYNAIAAANENNIISVAAAGNHNTDEKFYPAAYDHTVSIASVDSALSKSTFSNYGDYIDFATPGTNILSTLGANMAMSRDANSDFGIMSGTSMATPHAASAVAVLKSYNKNLTYDNVISLLKNYAVKDLGVAGKDIYYGNGFIYLDPESFCVNAETDNCEEFGVFKSSSKIFVTSFSVQSIATTDRNYGTVNNFNPTQIIVNYSNGVSAMASLGDLSGAEISGYDPYQADGQTVTIRWQGMEVSFNFTNPAHWASGWNYEIIDDHTAKITGFTDFNSGVHATKKLYLPAKLDGYNIVELAANPSGQSVFSDAAKTSYEEIILPDTLVEISGSQTFSDFTSLQKVTSLSPALHITGDNVFSNSSTFTLWIDTNSPAKDYAVVHEIPYEATNLSEIKISLEDFTFNVDDTVNTEVYAYFDRSVRHDDGYQEYRGAAGREEKISSDRIKIIYQNDNDSFQYGDTIFTIRGTTEYGEDFERSFNVILPQPTIDINPSVTDMSIVLKDDLMIIQDNNFNSIRDKITTQSASGEYIHHDKNGEPATSDTLKTGDIVKITLNGTKTYDYRVVYLGDTNGDGKISYLDYVSVYNHIQKLKNPELTKNALIDEYLLAADTSGDDKVNYLDCVGIYNKIKEARGETE